MAHTKSPDLNPELVESLVRSLASWDPRASVPLALTFMRVGDEEALDGFDSMALANPVAKEMLQERYLSPTPDVATTWTRACCGSLHSSAHTTIAGVTWATWRSGDSSSTTSFTS
jgi:hypothetical protein